MAESPVHAAPLRQTERLQNNGPPYRVAPGEESEQCRRLAPCCMQFYGRGSAGSSPVSSAPLEHASLWHLNRTWAFWSVNLSRRARGPDGALAACTLFSLVYRMKNRTRIADRAFRKQRAQFPAGF